MFTVKQGNTEIAINSIQSAYRTFVMNDIPEMTITAVKYNNDAAFDLLDGDSVVVVDDLEWRVQLETGRAPAKNLKLLHILADLIDMAPLNQTLTGTYTPTTLLNTVLSGTGFTLQLNTSGLSSVFVSEFGKKNRWQLLREACELLKAEFTVGPNRTVIVRKQLSSDKGQQIRYGHNLRNLSLIRDVSDIVTHVIVNYGENHAQTATFTSPTASNYARAHYGGIINDERILTYADARKRAEKEFKDIELAYELDVMNDGGQYELGETVHTIYEPLNDLSIVTRVQKIREDWNGEEFNVTDVTIGNYVFKPPEQIMREETEKNRVEADEKLDEKATVINNTMTLKFHETETKIKDQYTTITSEYNAAISISAKELRSDYTAKITTVTDNMVTMEETLSSSISQTAEQIRLEVNAHVKTINDGIVDMEKTLSSSITQTAESIRTEVNEHVKTINDGMTSISTAVSSVTQTAESIQSVVSAQSTSIDGLGTRMTSAESSITQTATEISSKVSYTDFTGQTIASLIEQSPYHVTIAASKINFNGHVFGEDSTWSGNITTAKDINIGRQITFSDYTTVSGSAGNLYLEAYGFNSYSANAHYFYGPVTFDQAPSFPGGLSASDVGGYSFAVSSSGGKTYLTVRQYGSYMGMAELS